MSRINTMEKRVRHIMNDYPRTRNDDVLLTLTLWWVYYRSLILEIDGKQYIQMNSIRELPREDHVKRVRAHIQNDLHELVPTDPEVAKKRGWGIDEWRGYLGYGDITP